MSSPGETTDDLDELFDSYNDTIADFLARADRTTLKASIFNVPKRTEITLPVYAGLAPWFFRQIDAQVTPEELGRRMRTLAGRPTAMHLGGVYWQTLLERERRLVLGLDPLPPDDTAWVLEWVGRALKAQRQDGSAFPGASTGWHHRILEPEALDALVRYARAREPAELKDLRYLGASLELYSFMLHGEHRDGIFDHGPYDLGGGEIAMVKDFTDLQSTFLPWSGPDVRLPHPAVSIVFVLDEAYRPRLSWAGTAEYDSEPYEHLGRAGVFTVGADGPVALGPEELRPLGAAAQQAQRQLFMAAVGWPEDEKVTYGAWLFANHLREFPRMLGLDSAINEEMVTRMCDGVALEYTTIDMAAPSPVWAALRRERPFTPLGARR